MTSFSKRSDKDRESKKQTETERKKERERETERDQEREREREKGEPCKQQQRPETSVAGTAIQHCVNRRPQGSCQTGETPNRA